MRDTSKFKQLGQTNTHHKSETEYNMRITTETHQYKHPIIESTTRRRCPKIMSIKIEAIIKMSCNILLIVLEYRPRFLYIDPITKHRTTVVIRRRSQHKKILIWNFPSYSHASLLNLRWQTTTQKI